MLFKFFDYSYLFYPSLSYPVTILKQKWINTIFMSLYKMNSNSAVVLLKPCTASIMLGELQLASECQNRLCTIDSKNMLLVIWIFNLRLINVVSDHLTMKNWRLPWKCIQKQILKNLELSWRSSSNQQIEEIAGFNW